MVIPYGVSKQNYDKMKDTAQQLVTFAIDLANLYDQAKTDSAKEHLFEKLNEVNGKIHAAGLVPTCPKGQVWNGTSCVVDPG